MNRSLLSLILLSCICCVRSHAQSLAINTDGSAANASALLDVKSSTKGILIPRMSRTERNAIVSPATGLMIYQNSPDSVGFYYYDGTSWSPVLSNANADLLAWKTGGNTGTLDGSHFIGTTDNIPLNFRVNNQKSGRIDNGQANAFFGYQAGNANTSGQSNAVFGHQAMLSNLSGTNNTALGGLAARDNTTGGQNTATGYASMVLNTVGQNNTAYGFYSMYNNVAGSNATAIGYQSMLYANNSTTPFTNNNVAVGFEALKGSATPAANTGLFNSAIGYQVLFSNSTGNGNTGIGYQAFLNNTTGSLNTALGMQAGYLATGSNNVFLGYQAGYNETGNNKLYIANNSSNPPIIYGDFSNKTLSFGTTTPNSTYGYAKVEIASEGFGAPTDLLIRNAVSNAGYAPGLVFQHARGTLATPVAVTNGDYLSAISTMNYDGSNYILSAGLDIFTDGPVAAGIVPSRLHFNTMNTTGSYAARLTIKNDGKIGIATITPAATLDVSGDFKLGAAGNASNALLRTTVNIDLPSIPANSEADITATVTGASITGSAVFVSPTADIEAGLVISWARVSAANTVKIRVRNNTGSAIDPAAVNYVISVLQ